MPDMKNLLTRLSAAEKKPERKAEKKPETPVAYFSRLPQVETPRLLLRRMTLRDAPDMYAYSRDREVARYVLWTAHESVWETKAYIRWCIQQYRMGAPSSWCMVAKATGRVVGTIGFMNWQPEHASVEVGYSLARSCWNQGLMTEALEAVLQECFTTMHMNRVEAQHFTANPASGRVMAKCGMTHEGTLRNRICNKGKYMDVEMWAILRSDWEKRRKAE